MTSIGRLMLLGATHRVGASVRVAVFVVGLVLVDCCSIANEARSDQLGLHGGTVMLVTKFG